LEKVKYQYYQTSFQGSTGTLFLIWPMIILKGIRRTKMAKSIQARLDKFMNGLKHRNPGEHEFHQAVYEVAIDVNPSSFRVKKTRSLS
jgi:hypothetical protein